MKSILFYSLFIIASVSSVFTQTKNGQIVNNNKGEQELKSLPVYGIKL